MSFCPLDHGSDSGACFLLFSIFLPPHALVVIFYNPALLNWSCKVFSDHVVLLAVMGKIISVSFLLLACHTGADQSAALGSVLHFCRSRIGGYVCSLRDKTRKLCSWDLLWEQWLSSPATERRALLYGAAFSNQHPASMNFCFCLVLERNLLGLYNEEVVIYLNGRVLMKTGLLILGCWHIQVIGLEKMCRQRCFRKQMWWFSSCSAIYLRPVMP